MNIANKQPPENHEHHVLAFDSLFTLYPLQICKILLPLLPPRYQGFLSIFIKYEELVYTIAFFQGKIDHPSCLPTIDPDKLPENLYDIITEIRPYCSENLRQTIDQMSQMMHTFDKMKDLIPLFEAMNQAEGDSSSSLFGAMMNADQRQSFSRFEHFFDES